MFPKPMHMRGIAESLHEAHAAGTHKDHGPCFACRRSIGQILETHAFEKLVVFLVIAEVAMTAFEIGMDNEWICLYGRHPNHAEGYMCESSKGEHAKVWLSFAAIGGKCILLFFATELGLKIAISPYEFFHHNSWHVLDLVVVLISLTIVFIISPHKTDWPLFIVIVRLWRVVKIMRETNKELKLWESEVLSDSQEKCEKLRLLCKENNVPIPPDLERYGAL